MNSVETPTPAESCANSAEIPAPIDPVDEDEHHLDDAVLESCSEVGRRPTVRGFQWDKRGLYRLKDGGNDEDGDPKHPGRSWISPPFTLPGLVRDGASQSWRMLIAWRDLDGTPHEEAVPFEQLSGEGSDLARVLSQGGLVLPPDVSSRKALLRYLCGAAPKLKRRVRLVDTFGWHDGAFVLPGGQTIGQANEPVRFSGDVPSIRGSATSGTLVGWKDGVARYAVGNPRLAFAIACAFAGPLLRMVRPDGGGGFNLQGFSSKGKSTCLEAATSVWHNPEDLPTWRATSNGLEGIAAARNDGFLPIDEMGQIKAEELGHTAYMLSNGSAKIRATREGGTRSLKQWRVIFLSSGEIGIEDKLSEDGKKIKAGQEVRVPDIPCPPSGMLDEAHDFPSPGHLAEHLKAQARKHYGHAACAFLDSLSNDWKNWDTLQAKLKAMEAEWLTAAVPVGADAQVRRVGGRFALVAVAGELAQRLGILPWTVGEASNAALICFEAWLDRRGYSGASEVGNGIGSVIAFLERHGNSRFDVWGDATARLDGDDPTRNPRTMNRVGTRKRAEGIDGWDFYITTEGWKEACHGFSSKDVAKACAGVGILEADGNGKLSHSVKIPGHGQPRCYVVRAASLARYQEGEVA